MKMGWKNLETQSYIPIKITLNTMNFHIPLSSKPQSMRKALFILFTHNILGLFTGEVL